MALKDAVKQIKQEHEEFQYPSFEDSELPKTNKRVISIWGDKNDAKTTVAYSIMNHGDSCYVLSFDNKSRSPLDLPFIKNMNLDVYISDAMKLYNKNTDPEWLSSSVRTIGYVHHLLNRYDPLKYDKEKYDSAKEVDWIVIDCNENLITVAEMSMRATYKLGVFSGVETQFWKERKRIVDGIHERALSIAKKGVIYTFYPKVKELMKKNGEVIESKSVPAWIGKVLTDTDVKIHTTTSQDSDGNWKYFATIEGSKDLFYRNGRYDITNQCLIDVLTVVNDINNK